MNKSYQIIKIYLLFVHKCNFTRLASETDEQFSWNINTLTSRFLFVNQRAAAIQECYDLDIFIPRHVLKVKLDVGASFLTNCVKMSYESHGCSLSALRSKCKAVTYKVKVNNNWPFLSLLIYSSL